MGVRYVLALNVTSACADRIDYPQLTIAVRNAVAMAGFGVEGPFCTKHSINSLGILQRRSVVTVSLNVIGQDTLSVAATRGVDTAVLTAIASAARAQWAIQSIVNGLPRQGDGSYSPSLLGLGEVGEVQRAVATGGGVPNSTITHPASSTVVQETTDPGIPVGTRTRSGAGDALQQGKDWLSENKPLVIGAIAVAGIIGVAVIVVKVK